MFTPWKAGEWENGLFWEDTLWLHFVSVLIGMLKSFRNRDLFASVSVRIQNANFPCTYILMTNRNVLPDTIVFLFYAVRPCWRFNLSVYFFWCVCVFLYVVLTFQRFVGKRSWVTSCILQNVLVSTSSTFSLWMKLALIPEAVTKPMLFLGGRGFFIFHLKLVYVVQTFWGSIKKAMFCGNSHNHQFA